MKRNIGYQRLPVSFPFHSQWMERAKARFESFSDQFGSSEVDCHLRVAISRPFCSISQKIISGMSCGPRFDFVKP